MYFQVQDISKSATFDYSYLNLKPCRVVVIFNIL